MIKIKESTGHRLLGHSGSCTVENTLKNDNCMHIFEEKDIVFVHDNEKADIGISMHGNPVRGVPKSRCILIKTEPPIYNLFWGINLCNPKYLEKYAAVMSDYILKDLHQTYFTFSVSTFEYVKKFFNKPKNELLCMMLRNKKLAIRLNNFIPGLRKFNKYSNMDLRITADLKFCEYLGPERYHSYGRGWCKKCFKGSPPHTSGIDDGRTIVFSKYKFTFCPENSRFNGYITEKPIWPMCCGSIPIYMGAPDVEKYLPKGTFIDYRNYTPKELCDYITNISEEKYNRYRDNIRKFVTSKEAADRFSVDAYAKKILSVIEEII